ncbi:hypothetical protein ATCV1_z079R [Acanthocystis turfacea chlorella virus 1]|uniref:Uncharacterized protein z079R n=1 Tax=Chlorovirus heliozoae TaxID=322019 RepID=A7K839_9PHYC|nr:hypothetical protein ATCV1_z079R [Acanthocystis turfacea chlorella virus 1]ABT16213.1 hypothetical protein ATCV1_z079R [Acanthocystis turfacea chlorella virus 1]
MHPARHTRNALQMRVVKNNWDTVFCFADIKFYEPARCSHHGPESSNCIFRKSRRDKTPVRYEAHPYHTKTLNLIGSCYKNELCGDAREFESHKVVLHGNHRKDKHIQGYPVGSALREAWKDIRLDGILDVSHTILQSQVPRNARGNVHGGKQKLVHHRLLDRSVAHPANVIEICILGERAGKRKTSSPKCPLQVELSPGHTLEDNVCRYRCRG